MDVRWHEAECQFQGLHHLGQRGTMLIVHPQRIQFDAFITEELDSLL
jgi:hypothetical protein